MILEKEVVEKSAIAESEIVEKKNHTGRTRRNESNMKEEVIPIPKDFIFVVQIDSLWNLR